MTITIFSGTKEIALPDELHKSLLSRSCDAKEVVLQMRDDMQLEQASLEQPDSKTKTLIRCLARKAKDSNRLDVFEHLREITPAGTTGELVFSEASCHQWLLLQLWTVWHANQARGSIVRSYAFLKKRLFHRRLNCNNSCFSLVFFIYWRIFTLVASGFLLT